MLKEFLNYIKVNNLFKQGDKILLAVSGGIDSIVMLDLFVKAGFNVGVAHCNFSLRADESDSDELFLSNYVKKLGTPYHTIKFDTNTYAKSNGISIQMAARELRYDWFEEIRQGHNYDYIAIAHNSDDVIETFFINLTRGTGIKGLTGIQPKMNRIVRPILFASRLQITEYCSQNELSYREDSTNKSVKYSRNKLRHDIIPKFKDINPNFNQTLLENINRLKEVEQIYNATIKEKKKQIISIQGEEILIKIDALKGLSPLTTYLYEFIKPYDFTHKVVDDILNSLDNISGKQFFSPTHRLIKGRDHLIITKLTDEIDNQYYIEEETTTTEEPIKLTITLFERPEDFKFPTNPNIACFDADLLTYPLIIRKWHKGDYFSPLGMKNKIKKLSDFFIDNKMSILEKEKTWLLTSDTKIAWIIGKRLDDRFKITPQTTRILMIELIN